MTREDVAISILKSNRIMEYEILTGTKSKCIYNRNGTSRIYLLDNNDNLEDIIVAAHEAAHLIIYKEYCWKYLYLKIMYVMLYCSLFLLCGCFVVLFLSKLMTTTTISPNLLYFFSIIAFLTTVIYFISYIEDEESAEQRALKEIRKLAVNKGIEVIISERISTRIKKSIKEKSYILMACSVFVIVFINIFARIVIYLI